MAPSRGKAAAGACGGPESPTLAVAPAPRRARSHAGLSGIQKAATLSSDIAGSAPSANWLRHGSATTAHAFESSTPAAMAGAKAARIGREIGPTTVSLMYSGFASVQKPMPSPTSRRPAQMAW